MHAPFNTRLSACDVAVTMSSPAKKRGLFSSSSSPSKKARTRQDLGKPKVKFVVHNQGTYKSGLVFVKFDQGTISEEFRTELKQLKD